MPTASTQQSQLCLPGQAHVAEGPHDQTGMYVMHHAFRRDLARFEAAVWATPVEDRETWLALEARWDRFGEVLHHHHSVEDESIWPVLLRHVDERCDAEGRATLEAMEAEHGFIDPALSACREGFSSMVDHPCEDHRHALEARVTDVRAALHAHLSHEEIEALPLLQEVMTEEEFAASEKAAAKGYPLRLVPFLLAWVSDGLPEQAMRHILSGAPPGYGLLLRLSTPRYRRSERKAFRHV